MSVGVGEGEESGASNKMHFLGLQVDEPITEGNYKQWGGGGMGEGGAFKISWGFYLKEELPLGEGCDYCRPRPIKIKIYTSCHAEVRLNIHWT